MTAEDLAAFFATGRAHVARVLDVVRTHLDPTFAPRRALDLGCGVGRVVIPLAAECEAVVGVDVSPAMLDEARRNCEGAGATTVELVEGDDDLSRVAGRFDLVHSFIVLQHVPVHRGERLVEALADRLDDGGVGVVHVTYAYATRPVGRVLYWARTRVPGAHAALNLLLGRSPRAPMMQGNAYSVTRLLEILRARRCGEVHVRFTDHQGNLGVLLFFRKHAPPPF
jgi:SAM-dependent methyltransferase